MSQPHGEFNYRPTPGYICVCVCAWSEGRTREGVSHLPLCIVEHRESWCDRTGHNKIELSYGKVLKRMIVIGQNAANTWLFINKIKFQKSEDITFILANISQERVNNFTTRTNKIVLIKIIYWAFSSLIWTPFELPFIMVKRSMR